MRHGRHTVLAVAVVLSAAVTARADDADAKAIVDKALRAHGGADTVAKFSATTTKFKGTVHSMGQALPFTGEIATQGADRVKVDVEAEAAGMKFRFVSVLSGDKGWIKAPGADTKEMDKDELAEAKEQAHAGWVASLVPLTGKGLTLAKIGEVEIDKRPALGVKVSGKGRRDVDLYFDKETGLLVKAESRVKDEGSGQEVTQESFYADYKDVQGVKYAMKITVKRDGKPYVEGEVTDVEFAEKLDAGVFAKP